jgi:hypothetical protein
MGFDPMAEPATAPFENCDSTRGWGEKLGVGARGLRRIEVIGAKIAELAFDYRKARGSGLGAGGGRSRG